MLNADDGRESDCDDDSDDNDEEVEDDDEYMVLKNGVHRQKMCG